MKKITTLAFSIALGTIIASCGGNTETESTATNSEMTEETKSTDTATDGNYIIQGDSSKVMWEGTMLKVGGVSLYGHNGTIDIQRGEIKLQGGNIAGGQIIIDMSTIEPLDKNYDGDKKPSDLVGHLSSDDFFNVEKFPRSNFVIENGSEDAVKGQLTIRDVTSPEKISGITVRTVDGGVKIKGKTTIDRQKYNVAFNMPAQDKVLSDDIVIEFDIFAKKQ